MKKSKSFKKIAILLTVAGLSTFLLMGCTNGNSNSSGSGQSQQSSSNRPSADQIKQNYETKLKTLVSAGTITQAQSDKILTTLTSRMGNRPSGGNSTGNRTGNYAGKGQGNRTGNYTGGGSNRQNFNPLNSLVQDGTLTQDQANTVWQSLRGSFGGNRNSSNSSGSNQ